MDFSITLALEDWDKDKGGWRCPALEIPGIEVRGIYVAGKAVDPLNYVAQSDLGIIRWSLGDPPRTAALHLKVAKQLSTQELTVRWKKLAIVLPVIGALASALLAVVLKSHFDKADPASQVNNDNGLLVIPKSNDFLASGGPMRFDHLLDQSKREAWFVGTTFYISVDAHRDLIRKKLSEGVDLNFIIFDPFGSHANDVARMLDIGPNELMDQCLLGIKIMTKLSGESRAAKDPGVLRVKLIDDPIYSRLYLFDPKSPDGVIYFVPQVNQSNSQMLPGFAASKAKFVAPYFDGALRTWNSSAALDLDAWSTKHSEIH